MTFLGFALYILLIIFVRFLENNFPEIYLILNNLKENNGL